MNISIADNGFTVCYTTDNPKGEPIKSSDKIFTELSEMIEDIQDSIRKSSVHKMMEK